MFPFTFDVAAALSALGGALIGALSVSFRLGQHSKIVEMKIDALDEKIVYISDELARRITVIEQRIQYDGLYISPRLKRDHAG